MTRMSRRLLLLLSSTINKRNPRQSLTKKTQRMNTSISKANPEDKLQFQPSLLKRDKRRRERKLSSDQPSPRLFHLKMPSNQTRKSFLLLMLSRQRREHQLCKNTPEKSCSSKVSKVTTELFMK